MSGVCFDHVHINITVTSTSSQGHTYLMSYTGRFNRWCYSHLYCQGRISGSTPHRATGSCIIDNRAVKTERRQQFECGLLSLSTSRLGTDRVRTTAYPPASKISRTFPLPIESDTQISHEQQTVVNVTICPDRYGKYLKGGYPMFSKRICFRYDAITGRRILHNTKSQPTGCTHICCSPTCVLEESFSGTKLFITTTDFLCAWTGNLLSRIYPCWFGTQIIIATLCSTISCNFFWDMTLNVDLLGHVDTVSIDHLKVACDDDTLLLINRGFALNLLDLLVIPEPAVISVCQDPEWGHGFIFMAAANGSCYVPKLLRSSRQNTATNLSSNVSSVPGSCQESIV